MGVLGYIICLPQCILVVHKEFFIQDKKVPVKDLFCWERVLGEYKPITDSKCFKDLKGTYTPLQLRFGSNQKLKYQNSGRDFI
jgi:hypothetical protein